MTKSRLVIMHQGLAKQEHQIEALLKAADDCLKDHDHDLLCTDLIELCDSILERFNKDWEILRRQDTQSKLVSYIRFKKILQREIINKRKFVDEVKLKVKNSLAV